MRLEKNKDWLALIHLSGLFLLFFPSTIIWNRKKDELKEITDHYQNIIQFQLSIWFIFLLPGLVVSYYGGGGVTFAAGIIFGIASAILNAIKVSKGKSYKYFSLIQFNDIKKVLFLSLLFIPIAFAHNFFHEFGHWIVGKLQGYNIGIRLNGVWLKEGNYLTEIDSVLV